jgi:RNA polymerase sigma-70 factor (ECF subfamily)
MSDERPPDIPDAELLQRALTAPEAAARRRAASSLFERYQRKVYLWCYRHVRDHERALELAQDAMLNAYRSLESFGERASFSSWLFAITRNRCISDLRKRDLPRDDETELDGLAHSGGTPERILEEREGEDRLLRLIREHLDEVEQQALWLRCVERLRVEEVTRLLGLDLASGARAVLQRARRKLKAALDREEAAERKGRP